MHYRLIVTTEAKDRVDAIERVKAWLETQKEEYIRNPCIPNDDDDDAYIHMGFWDWYVIGGRWSGNLMIAYFPDFWKRTEALKKEAMLDHFAVTKYGGVKQETVDLQNSIYDQLDIEWSKHVRSDLATLRSPMRRDEYQKEGYSDDILLIDEPIQKYITSIWKSEPDQFNNIYSADLQHETPDTSFIGRKWAIVIDYHR